jgi:hypothetical protein
MKMFNMETEKNQFYGKLFASIKHTLCSAMKTLKKYKICLGLMRFHYKLVLQYNVKNQSFYIPGGTWP